MACCADARWTAVVCALLIGAAAGCGGTDRGDQTAALTVPDATPPPQLKPQPLARASIRILLPRDGRRVRMAPSVRGHGVARIEVSGSAEPRDVVRVNGHCAPRSCAPTTFSDGTGRWAVELRGRPAQRDAHWKLDATYAVEPAKRTSDQVILRLRQAPATAAKVRGDRPDPTAVAQIPVTTAPARRPRTGHGRLLLIGDSLAVGVQDLLPRMLPGWQVTVDGRVSRPLAEGMSVLSRQQVDSSTVLALSLFTNDDPTRVGALRAAVAASLQRVTPTGCVIWATIVRPPVNGVSYAPANSALAALSRADPRLRIVPWAAAVAANPAVVGADGVHPTPAGYALRAQLYADAARSCD